MADSTASPTLPAQNHADRPVYVIGGGPGGLAAAYALRAQGIRAVVLEKSDRVGASWRRHYDRLHLHTTRRLSALPGLAIPRRFGRWVSRDDVVRYLEKYAEVHELEIVTGVEVSRIERSADGTGWLLHATGGRELTGRAVVVATGTNPRPASRTGPVATPTPATSCTPPTTATPSPTSSRDVLVVGIGNTGAEIAVDLVEGGASRVRLAVRTAPHILRRSTAGWAAQYTGVLVRRLPVALVDRLAGPVGKLSVPDLAAHGLPRPDTGLYSRVKEGSIPVQDVGLIDAVRKGRVEVVTAVESFEDGKVVLAAAATASALTRWSRPRATSAPWSDSSATWACWTPAASRSCTARTPRRTRPASTSPASPTPSAACSARWRSTPRRSRRRSPRRPGRKPGERPEGGQGGLEERPEGCARRLLTRGPSVLCVHDSS